MSNNKAICKVFLCFIFFWALVFTMPQIHAASSNNFLADVKFNIGSLDQPFNSNVINYDLTLPEGTKSVQVEAVASDAKAKVNIGGTNLSTGKVVITVQAESGAKKYYTFFVKYGKVSNVTTTTTTTKKPTTTVTTTTTTTTTVTTTTNDSGTTSTSTSEVPEVTTSTESSSTYNKESSKLLYLGVKGGKLNVAFETNKYEYTALVDSISEDYEIEYIQESDIAVTNITRSKDKYVVEVINESDKTTYVINLKDLNENAITSENSSMGTVMRDLLISFVLFVIALLFFYLSKRLSHE